ncbi:hypothetical protein GCM10023195_25300 [Actinoallomurus liliacearum]|uniref:Antitoxin n=1 Tax=Actinoallomurus liliacearum TaxID=1080073 RepID=A0ABP8TJG6_9ACTN
MRTYDSSLSLIEESLGNPASIIRKGRRVAAISNVTEHLLRRCRPPPLSGLAGRADRPARSRRPAPGAVAQRRGGRAKSSDNHLSCGAFVRFHPACREDPRPFTETSAHSFSLRPAGAPGRSKMVVMIDPGRAPRGETAER